MKEIIEKLIQKYPELQKKEIIIDIIKAHQELVKDKLFTVEDIEKAFRAGGAYTLGSHEDFQQIHLSEKEYIQSLQPTEWDVKFNEQGKLELL